MPRGDGTGPAGAGPMTGRGMGYCAGYPTPGFANPGPGRGLWWCGGRARGWRWWYRLTGLPGYLRAIRGYPAFGWWRSSTPPSGLGISSKDEAEFLKKQAEVLKEELDEIQARLEELEKLHKKEEDK